jgi:hypothetical protein
MCRVVTVMAFTYNCVRLRDQDVQKNFVDGFEPMIKSFTLLDVPVLYRGFRLNNDEPKYPRPVAFFTPNLEEAAKYAKHDPRTIYIYESNIDMKVIDLTKDTSINALQDLAARIELPRRLITDWAAKDIAANVPFEDDMFTLLSITMFQKCIHGFYRRTVSSTLGRSAVQYDIYRCHLPDHIK